MRDQIVVLIIFVFIAVECRTVYLQLQLPSKEELSFLRKYGYLEEEEPGVDYVYSWYSISEAVQKMQAYAGLPATGVIDPQTKTLFNQKRCGVKDIDDNVAGARRRRYVLQQGWNKKTISYKVINEPSTLKKAQIEDLMAKGLAVWAPHGGLTFQHLDNGTADIQVSFASNDHGDGFPFDGPGRVVAHAFPPPHGAMHFDNDELWGIDMFEEDDDVTDFFAVAVHEIGHALGLSHSAEKASVMYPYYQVPIEKLHMDDILGMKELYLKDQSVQQVLSSAPTTLVPRFTKASWEEGEVPDLCSANYHAMQVIQGKIFVFEEEWVWVLAQRKRIEPGFPRRFHDMFPGLPAHVDAVRAIYETRQGNIRIFKGQKYWEFDPAFNLVGRGSITEYGIPGDVDELDAVFVSNYNNKTYLIQEERFWRYDERTGRMDRGYPKDMSAWRQIPHSIQSAFIWQGDTFFFVGPRFWRFDNELVQAHEYYPLPTAQVWFPCPTTADMRQFSVTERP